jgi:hypothetical protein
VNHLNIKLDKFVAPTNTWTILPILIHDTSDPDVGFEILKFSNELVVVKSWSIESTFDVKIGLQVESQIHLEILFSWCIVSFCE